MAAITDLSELVAADVASGDFIPIHDVTAGTDKKFDVNGLALMNNGILRLGTYTPGDTTPSVARFNYMSITNGGPTTITNFDDGYAGQLLVLTFTDSNTTVNRSNCLLAGSAAFVSTANATLVLVHNGTYWIEINRITNNA